MVAIPIRRAGLKLEGPNADASVLSRLITQYTRREATGPRWYRICLNVHSAFLRAFFPNFRVWINEIDPRIQGLVIGYRGRPQSRGRVFGSLGGLWGALVVPLMSSSFSHFSIKATMAFPAVGSGLMLR